MIARALVLALASLGVLATCDSDEATTSGVRPAPPQKPWDTLAEWRLFTDAQRQVPADGVVPFEVIAPLFSDLTAKHRFVWLPAGTVIGYQEDGPWDLPVGAIVVKTFAYPIDQRDPALGERILETRLLVREPGGWVPHTYVWDAAQTEARRKVAGTFIESSWIDASGATVTHRYVVPTTNECHECHGQAPATRLLGVKTAQLDRDGQLQRLADAGYLASVPAPGGPRFMAPDGEGEVETRARSYLDANCAHCHSAAGDVDGKALYLDFASTAPDQPLANRGVCKIPTSAGGATCGHVYDVLPGDAAHSVIICRMRSTEGAEQMPPIGRGLVDEAGVALIEAWIDGMEPTGCD